jgi:hypothetical protein
VAQPFLHQVERDAGANGRHTKPVPQTLRRGMRAVQPGRFHHGVDGAPAGHPVPGPERTATTFARRYCTSRMPCTMSSVSRRAGGTGTAW